MMDTVLHAHFERTPCQHEAGPDLEHPNITAVHITFNLTPDAQRHTSIATPPSASDSIGFIDANILHKRNMHSLWFECRIFDMAHASEAKLHKVENYLSNACFHAEKQALIDGADHILYIEKVYLNPTHRGKGLGLSALIEAIRAIELGERCVVLFEPGPITLPLAQNASDWKHAGTEAYGADDSTDEPGTDATEKIARHWKRMGFSEWSYTDQAWLCRWTGESSKEAGFESAVMTTDTVAWV